jgi:cytoskeletal protein CcmA (bactofilin family)
MVADRSSPETREILCTHCEGKLEVSAHAMSVNCHHCNRRVIIEDLKIKAYHAVVKLATAGRVEIAKRAQVVAKVRVHDLIVKGEIKGDVVAVDRIEISKQGAITGDVSCKRLEVAPGARLSGFFRVEPGFEPEPQAESQSNTTMTR